MTARWPLTHATRHTIGALTAALGVLIALALPYSSVRAQQAGAQRQLQAAPRFVHAQHEKVFPQCNACHRGIPTGDRVTSFPDTALCIECHNNRDLKRTTWTVPNRASSNLRYSHADHQRQAGATASNCSGCHAAPDNKWMHVQRATPEQCQSCHTHRATSHFAVDNKCSTCHVPLVQAIALPASRVAAFPKPPTHAAADFASKHAVSGVDAQTQCAMCHAKESCARCHINATSVATQYKLLPDARIATLVAGKAAVYVTPATHRAADFLDTHGPSARANALTCANCHARSSCRACHIGEGASDVIAKIPVAEVGGASGVHIKPVVAPSSALTLPSSPIMQIALGPAPQTGKSGTAPDARKTQIHPSGFARTHGASAASGRTTCEGCHAKSYCADCHGGESKRRFHIANFAARHAPEAWGRETDCQQCHNPEVFCRGCHMQVGLSSKGRSNVGYHSAIPLWVLQHGQAARQGLQSCTSCHTQKDCMQCHSESGRRISPHGPDFDAKRMWKANRLICLRCHFKDPLDGR